MAWRPHRQLISGVLTNVEPGRVTGELMFRGLDTSVQLDLTGDFHRDIRGAAIKLEGVSARESEQESREYMRGFCTFQSGAVGDITAGNEPCDYVDYPYIEWYSNQNGRIVLELMPEMLTVVGEPIDWRSQKPIDPAASQEKCKLFLADLARSILG